MIDLKLEMIVLKCKRCIGIHDTGSRVLSTYNNEVNNLNIFIKQLIILYVIDHTLSCQVRTSVHEN